MHIVSQSSPNYVNTSTSKSFSHIKRVKGFEYSLNTKVNGLSKQFILILVSDFSLEKTSLFICLQGFLQPDLVPKALEKLTRKIQGVSEDFMKTLESVDGLVG